MDDDDMDKAIAKLLATDPVELKREAIAAAKREAPQMTEAQLEAHWAFTALQLGL